MLNSLIQINKIVILADVKIAQIQNFLKILVQNGER